jgi:uncharacterized protein YciI
VPLFSLVCIDKPDSLALRQSTRPAHLDYMDATGLVRLGGPLLDPQGESPIGSLLIVEADDLAAVEAFAAADPYAQAGLFERVEIRPYRVVVNAL